jgi:hypothetical protein
VHKDPSAAVGLDRVDALDVASHAGDHVVVLLGVDDISVDVDAWADDVLEYVVVGEEDRASDDHALADAHTSDVAGDDVVAAATAHPSHQDLDGACDAVQAVKLEVEDPDSDRDDNQASFHWAVQLHYFHYLAGTSFPFHVDLVDLFDHHSVVSAQSLADNHFPSVAGYFHSANALVPLLVAVLVMPFSHKTDLKSLRNTFLS